MKVEGSGCSSFPLIVRCRGQRPATHSRSDKTDRYRVVSSDPAWVTQGATPQVVGSAQRPGHPAKPRMIVDDQDRTGTLARWHEPGTAGIMASPAHAAPVRGWPLPTGGGFQISGKWALSVDPREPCFASWPHEPGQRVPGLHFGMVLLWPIAGTGPAARPAHRCGAAAGRGGLFSSAWPACGCCSCGARAR